MKSEASDSQLCGICKKGKLHHRYTLLSLYPSLQCEECYSQFLIPMPDQASIDNAYDDSYYGDSDRKFSGIIAWFFALARRYQARFLQRTLRKGSRLLDIGAGDGTFAQTVSDLGFEVYANELPGRAADRLSMKKGIKVAIGPFGDNTFAGTKFDVITLWHVLEHLPSPELLSEMVMRLSDKGRLYVAVPNIESWQARFFRKDWFHWDPPRHIFLPTKNGLSMMLESHGLKLVEQHNFFFQYNVFGWQQSLLNMLGFPRDQLFSKLKASSAPKSRLVQLVCFGYLSITLLPALFCAVVESVFARGGTVLWVYQRT